MAERATTATEIAALIRDAEGAEAEALCERYGEDPRKQVRQAVEAARRRAERLAAERQRVEGMYALMRELGGSGAILGVDEVGRGPVAGPVTVCAVQLPDEPIIWGIDDSKKLSAAKREMLAADIAETALAIGIAHVEAATIDALGMGIALRQAMRMAIEDSGVDADAVLIDGNPVHVHPNEKTIVHGDARVACIAAASIVAKVARDAIMAAADAQYPGYFFAQNKGYASAEHIAAIQEKGLSPIHRVSFCGNFLATPSLF